jgi:hypothetical protein
MLAKLVGTTLQGEAGIVFGKVRKGWTVEFSGRAERPIFFDANRVQVAASQTDQDRYFALLNAAPGAHLLYAVKAGASDRAAVALPVLDSTASYVELTDLGTIDLRGRVLDATSRTAAPLASVNVRVVGQSGKLDLTDKNGRFEISRAVKVADLPLYVETLDREGYTHRYRARTDANDSLTLFRFPQKAVTGWLQQLEGGISAESGIAIGAVPMLAAAHERNSLVAHTRPMLGGTTLKPETYSLSVDDRLLESGTLDAVPPRFLSVQLPEGGNVAQIENKSQQTVWSELIFASPGVVNVVGPY